MSLLLACIVATFSTCLAGGPLYGAAYTPYRQYGACPEEWQVYEDLQMVMSVTKRVRMYSMECQVVNRIVLQYATEGKLELLLGVWIDNRSRDQGEVEDLMSALREYPWAKINGIVVGNEVMYRNTLHPSSLAGRIYEVRHRVRALGEETGSEILKTTPIYAVEAFPHPEVVAASDCLGVNVHPFYVPDLPNYGSADEMAEGAVVMATKVMDLFKGMYPGKPLVVTEIGWPTSSSYGSALDKHTGSMDIATKFMWKWKHHAEINNIPYYYFEIFDSPWRHPLFPSDSAEMSDFNFGLYYADRRTPKWHM